MKLLRGRGAVVEAASFVVNLADLGGEDKMRVLDVPMHALLSFPGH